MFLPLPPLPLPSLLFLLLFILPCFEPDLCITVHPDKFCITQTDLKLLVIHLPQPPKAGTTGCTTMPSFISRLHEDKTIYKQSLPMCLGWVHFCQIVGWILNVRVNLVLFLWGWFLDAGAAG